VRVGHGLPPAHTEKYAVDRGVGPREHDDYHATVWSDRTSNGGLDAATFWSKRRCNVRAHLETSWSRIAADFDDSFHFADAEVHNYFQNGSPSTSESTLVQAHNLLVTASFKHGRPIVGRSVDCGGTDLFLATLREDIATHFAEYAPQKIDAPI
jgi:hypothetical protein